MQENASTFFQMSGKPDFKRGSERDNLVTTCYFLTILHVALMHSLFRAQFRF